MESNERGIWALKVSLVGLGATALFQLVVVLISGSVALLADTIHNFADAATRFSISPKVRSSIRAHKSTGSKKMNSIFPFNQQFGEHYQKACNTTHSL